MFENLIKARDCASFVKEDLQEHMWRRADPVESIVIMELIKTAAILEQKIQELLIAKGGIL